ncbi:MAG: energy-coupling factor transporter transmembrane component T [Anaerolineae bacterium]
MSPRPSVYGYLLLLVWAVAATLALPDWRAAWVLGALLAVRLALGPGEEAGLRVRWRWMLILGGLVLAPWALAGEGGRWAGFLLGLQMALRASAVLVAAHLFASAVSVAELVALFEGLGARGLGFAVGVAFNLLPTVQEIARTTYHAMRLRGAFRRPGLRAARLFLVTLVVGALRHADEIVAAAEARAFDPAGPAQARVPRPVRADAGLAVLVLVTTAAALLW